MSTATATMRSAVIRRAGRVEMVDVALPEPGPREIRVALEGCGVCGSDLPVWEGRSWFAYPREPGAPGHEGWAESTPWARRSPSPRRVIAWRSSATAQARLDHVPADLDISRPAIGDGSLVHLSVPIVRDRATHPAPLPCSDGRNRPSPASSWAAQRSAAGLAEAPAPIAFSLSRRL